MSEKDFSAANMNVPTAHARPDEIKRASFWVSQCFILLATVLGVYLASSQGFKQALAYGELQSAKTNYYLRKSLRDEIRDNIPPIRAYLTGVASGSSSARKEPISMDTFVWECLKSSSSTLETPSNLLRESRKFYLEVEDIHKKIGDGYYAIGEGQDKMEKAIARMESDILPKFDSDLRNLRDHLGRGGVTVE